MMKQAFVVLTIVGVVFSAPQPRKVFSEHVQDFLDVIVEESASEIAELMEQYLEFEEFRAALDYVQSTNFKDLVYEMEGLPEFNAVIEFLENDNIDIHTFIDIFNGALDEIRIKKRSARLTPSGNTMSSFIYDCIELFPKEKLAALFDEKMASDDEFSTALINLQSEEWGQVVDALFESESFKKEVDILAANGIEMKAILDEMMAVFGQN